MSCQEKPDEGSTSDQRKSSKRPVSSFLVEPFVEASRIVCTEKLSSSQKKRTIASTSSTTGSTSNVNASKTTSSEMELLFDDNDELLCIVTEEVEAFRTKQTEKKEIMSVMKHSH